MLNAAREWRGWGPLAQRLEQRTHNHFRGGFRLLFRCPLFSYKWLCFQFATANLARSPAEP
jgi:hypothetical protein